MPNYDNAEMQSAGGSIQAESLKELKIIAFLLRQGFNITDEDASLSTQTSPTAPTSTNL